MDLSYLNDLDADDFYETLMSLSENKIEESVRQKQNRVYGCTSRVWVMLEDNKLVFDSDSMFVKGLITAVVNEIKTIEDMKNAKVENYSFLTTDKITYQRIKGIDSFLHRVRHLATLNKV